jgi:hypothetical protein
MVDGEIGSEVVVSTVVDSVVVGLEVVVVGSSVVSILIVVVLACSKNTMVTKIDTHVSSPRLACNSHFGGKQPDRHLRRE